MNSEEKLENETVFVRQQKDITNSQISTNTRNRETKLIIKKDCLRTFRTKFRQFNLKKYFKSKNLQENNEDAN